MGNPNDEIRDAVLRHLYEIHQRARSPKSAAIGIQKIQKALRPRGYKQQEVASNLDYLVQKGWVAEIVTERTFTTKGGATVPAEKRNYKISHVGIDLLEGASLYRREPAGPRVNVTTIQGVTVVGNGNVVNTGYADLAGALDQLSARVLQSSDLEDSLKLDVAADVGSLQSQLQKPEPNRSVIKMLWSGIEGTLTMVGLAELVSKVASLLRPLL